MPPKQVKEEESKEDHFLLISCRLILPHLQLLF